MKRMILSIMACLLIVPALQAEVLNGTGKATYSVRATGHTVQGEVDLKPFEATLEDGILAMAIDAKILDMTTHKEKRDEEMYHVLHAEAHPLIHGETKGIDLGKLKAAGEGEALLPLSFSLAGVDVQKDAEVVSVVEDEDGVEMTLRFDVSQLEHFLTPIKKFMFLTVDDTVHVEVQLALVR